MIPDPGGNPQSDPGPGAVLEVDETQLAFIDRYCGVSAIQVPSLVKVWLPIPSCDAATWTVP